MGGGREGAGRGMELEAEVVLTKLYVLLLNFNLDFPKFYLFESCNLVQKSASLFFGQIPKMASVNKLDLVEDDDFPW